MQVACCDALGRANRWQTACDRLRPLLVGASRLELEPALACAAQLLESDLDRGLVISTARGFQRLDRPGDAEAWLARYARENPDDLEVAEFRADLLEAQGDHEAALRVFQPLVQPTSAPARAVERAGLLALAAGQADAARTLLKRAFELTPSDPVAQAACERAQELWRSQQIARQQGDASKRQATAALLTANGQHEQAIALLGAELGTPPERGYFGFACERLADDPAAAEGAVRWVARRTGLARGSAGYHEALYRVAQLFEARGEADDARRLYLEVHQSDPAFRDVAARLETLSQTRTRPSPLTSGRLPEGPPRTVFEAVRDANLELA